jgi:hypothetical protein
MLWKPEYDVYHLDRINITRRQPKKRPQTTCSSLLSDTEDHLSIIMWLNVIIAFLQLNFLFMSYTVERAYCKGPLETTDTTPLVKTTIEFCEQYNPLFLERPTWLVEATCIHAQLFWILYTAILIMAISNSWGHRVLQNIILLGLGAKLNAVLFYHYMEFTSDQPPPNLLAYFGAEGAYMVSIGLVLYKIFTTSCQDSTENALKTKTKTKAT